MLATDAKLDAGQVLAATLCGQFDQLAHAHRHAETLDLAHRPVRYFTSAPHQDRCPRHRVEDPDPHPVAHGLSQPAGIRVALDRIPRLVI